MRACSSSPAARVARLTLFSAILLGGCATHHAISGRVLDRNGHPLPRVIVSLEPGGVELVTDSEGAFLIDYLRNEQGERVKLARRTDYRLDVLKPGFHAESTKIHYRRGDLSLEPITMVEDTLEIGPTEEDIDPAKYRDNTHSDGSNYEGE